MKAFARFCISAFAVSWCARKFPPGIAMPHFVVSFSIPGVSCRNCQLSFQNQAHIQQDTLDFIQRLSAKIFGFQHIGLCALRNSPTVAIFALRRQFVARTDSSRSSMLLKRCSFNFSPLSWDQDAYPPGDVFIKINENRDLILDNFGTICSNSVFRSQ